MSQPAAPAPPGARRNALILGVAQTLAWAVTYYLPAVVAPVVVADLGADPALVYGAFSLALLISGLAAPRVGRAIEGRGGRPVLLASAALLALGLALLGLLPGLWGWTLGWVVLGLGMAMGLYEAAFATLGVLYGRAARRPITLVTLLAGFASTVGWPLSAALVPLLGWRGTCLAYAALLLLVVMPLYLLLPRSAAPAAAAPGAAPEAADPALPAAWVRRSFLLLAVFFTLRAIISATLAVHLIAVLGGLGLSVAAAVAAASLMGPAQVGGRLLEFTLGRAAHPLTAARLGGALLPLGALLLVLAGPLAAVPFVLLYGASNGIMTISRGALPLALFGARGYPVLMGKLALPILLAQAGAPMLTAPLVAGLPAVTVLGLAGLLALAALGCLLPLRRAP
ncbi:MFS transporter [Dankookia sp. GCM10030260]|uniref:MFS transporter n=1 Tax=Dankookia sp. GCM10030260 TaxID=3273390 RepID=UPI00360FAF69